MDRVGSQVFLAKSLPPPMPEMTPKGGDAVEEMLTGSGKRMVGDSGSRPGRQALLDGFGAGRQCDQVRFTPQRLGKTAQPAVEGVDMGRGTLGAGKLVEREVDQVAGGFLMFAWSRHVIVGWRGYSTSQVFSGSRYRDPRPVENTNVPPENHVGEEQADMVEQADAAGAVSEERRQRITNLMRSGGTYQVEQTASEIRDDLAVIATLDSEAEQGLGKAGGFLGCGVMLGIMGVMILLGALVAMAEPGNGAPAGAFAVMAFILVAVCVVMCIKSKALKEQHAGLDIDNRQYTTVQEILRMVSADMASDAMVSVRLDLSSHSDPSKQTDSGKVSYWNVEYFEHDWCDLSGQLLDGTRFSINFFEKHQERNRTSRSASGKIKHKHKTKGKSQLTVSLKCKAKRYPRLAQVAAEAEGAVRLPSWVELKSVGVEGDKLTMSSISKAQWGHGEMWDDEESSTDYQGCDWVAASLHSLYRVLNKAK